MSDRYNGWTNHATWCVNLWLTNEEGSYRYWRSEVQEVWDDTKVSKGFSREENAIFRLADRMKDEIEESIPKSIPGMFLDLLTSALSDVNWNEIARHFIEEEVDTNADPVREALVAAIEDGDETARAALMDYDEEHK